MSAYLPNGHQLREGRYPLCLSYHPEGPLTEEEVVIRARQGTRRSPDGRQPRHD